jgi:hypothetical protein
MKEEAAKAEDQDKHDNPERQAARRRFCELHDRTR